MTLMGFKYPDMFHILPCSFNYQTNNLYKDFNVISEQVITFWYSVNCKTHSSCNLNLLAHMTKNLLKYTYLLIITVVNVKKKYYDVYNFKNL